MRKLVNVTDNKCLDSANVRAFPKVLLAAVFIDVQFLPEQINFLTCLGSHPEIMETGSVSDRGRVEFYLDDNAITHACCPP